MRRGSGIPWQRRGVTCWMWSAVRNYWASQILGPFGSPQGAVLLRKRFFFYCAILGRLDITQKWFEVWLTVTSFTQSKCTGLSSQETHSLTLFVMADSPLHSKEKWWVVKSPVWHFFSLFLLGLKCAWAMWVQCSEVTRQSQATKKGDLLVTESKLNSLGHGTRLCNWNLFPYSANPGWDSPYIGPSGSFAGL